jgi:ribosomal protein S18 acetylase RimI-like enzyme
MTREARSVRPARQQDAAPLARLIDIAGEGIPTYLWAQAAEAGETALEVGVRRAAREEGGFSYRNAFVDEVEGQVAGMLLGYRQPDPYDPGDLSDLPAVVRPMVELEALAPGSWYVNALAVFPAFRGRGLGSGLLALAVRLAGESGARALSVIVAAENAPARALYERNGYRAAARRPVVAFSGFAHGGDWMLMVKDAGS